MDRLTLECGACDMASTEFCHSQSDCYTCSHGREVFRRLSEYENTGLNPQDIKTTIDSYSLNSDYIPCWWCGKEAKLFSNYLWSNSGWGKSYMSYHVECTHCGKRGKSFNSLDDFDARDKAVMSWNERVLCPVNHSTTK